MSKRGSGSSARAGGTNQGVPKEGSYGDGEHEFDYWHKGHWVTDYSKMRQAREQKEKIVVDNSKYKKTHEQTREFVKKQIGLDLNKYRTGDGSDSSMTTYWDKSGYKVAINFKGMAEADKTKLMQLSSKSYGVNVEQGNAWIWYVSRKKKK